MTSMHERVKGLRGLGRGRRTSDTFTPDCFYSKLRYSAKNPLTKGLRHIPKLGKLS